MQDRLYHLPHRSREEIKEKTNANERERKNRAKLGRELIKAITLKERRYFSNLWHDDECRCFSKEDEYKNSTMYVHIWWLLLIFPKTLVCSAGSKCRRSLTHIVCTFSWRDCHQSWYWRGTPRLIPPPINKKEILEKSQTFYTYYLHMAVTYFAVLLCPFPCGEQ